MDKITLMLFVFGVIVLNAHAQTLKYEGKEFEACNVKASVVSLNGEKVLKAERDLSKLPFNPNNLSKTVDEPTFFKA